MCVCVELFVLAPPEKFVRAEQKMQIECRVDCVSVCVCVLWQIGLISIRPIRVYRRAATGVALVRIASMQRVTGTILTAMPAAIGIVFLNDRGFLLNDLQRKLGYFLASN